MRNISSRTLSQHNIEWLHRSRAPSRSSSKIEGTAASVVDNFFMSCSAKATRPPSRNSSHFCCSISHHTSIDHHVKIFRPLSKKLYHRLFQKPSLSSSIIPSYLVQSHLSDQTSNICRATVICAISFFACHTICLLHFRRARRLS